MPSAVRAVHAGKDCPHARVNLRHRRPRQRSARRTSRVEGSVRLTSSLDRCGCDSVLPAAAGIAPAPAPVSDRRPACASACLPIPAPTL
ncbi:hypothetical protein [Lysobacter gummosus]|uniref:hypothetical protein n=1 Tax=Lysobacter gummosus TaxID=262324 RepID=UPI003626B715